MTSVRRIGSDTEAANMAWESDDDQHDFRPADSAPHTARMATQSKHRDRQASAEESSTVRGRPSTGPEICELNDEIDQGYDADVEHVYPDGYEDASDADAEIELPNETDIDKEEEKPPHQADLVHRFRRLHCERAVSANHQTHSRDNSGGSSALKRSHSQESLTDTEEDVLPDDASPASTPSQRRTRRRLTPSRSHTRASTAPSPDRMEIDVEEPSSEVVGKDT